MLREPYKKSIEKVLKPKIQYYNLLRIARCFGAQLAEVFVSAVTPSSTLPRRESPRV